MVSQTTPIKFGVKIVQADKFRGSENGSSSNKKSKKKSHVLTDMEMPLDKKKVVWQNLIVNNQHVKIFNKKISTDPFMML